jgi:purine-cytosine permease-like protein
VETLGSLDTEALGGGLLSKMVSGSVDLAMKQCDNKMIILIITLVSLLLCFLGALQMRKLRKTGFNVYTVGELLLPVATIFILGSNSIMGAAVVSGLLIPIIFVILYSTQYKYLRD